MLHDPGALFSPLTNSTYARSLEAARMHEITSAVRRQRQDQRNQKRTNRRHWFTARPIA